MMGDSDNFFRRAFGVKSYEEIHNGVINDIAVMYNAAPEDIQQWISRADDVDLSSLGEGSVVKS